MLNHLKQGKSIKGDLGAGISWGGERVTRNVLACVLAWLLTHLISYPLSPSLSLPQPRGLLGVSGPTGQTSSLGLCSRCSLCLDMYMTSFSRLPLLKLYSLNQDYPSLHRLIHLPYPDCHFFLQHCQASTILNNGLIRFMVYCCISH